MDNKKTEIRACIDKLMKSYSNDNLPKKEINGNEVVDIFEFLNALLSHRQSGWFPESKRSCESLMVLSSSHVYEKTSTFSYEKSFKYACDINHPSIYNIKKILDITHVEAEKLIRLVKQHNGSYLDYFHLFKDPGNETDLSVFSIDAVVDKIDEIAKNSTYGTVVSHPAKMSHPDLKFPKIFFDKSNSALDGYIRTGNVDVGFDLHINANKLKVFKFLSLLINNRPILEFIRQKDYKSLAHQFSISEQKADEWVNVFSQCLFSQDGRTNSLVKQVYFPISDSYHQLSILQPSGLVFSLKDKIDNINSRTEQAYRGREAKKENTFYEPGYSTISNLTVTKHGGEHPKNISALNNKYQMYYLLDSSPPDLQRRDIQFPIKDFFKSSIRFYDIQEPLQKLHGIFSSGLDSPIPRRNLESGRDVRIEEILEQIIERMTAVRAVASEQYREESSSLPHYQKVWLTGKYLEERHEQDEWLDELCETTAKWVVAAYKKVVKKPVTLGPAEYNYIKEMLDTYREALR